MVFQIVSYQQDKWKRYWLHLQSHFWHISFHTQHEIIVWTSLNQLLYKSFAKLQGYDFYELADILAENIRSWDLTCPIAQCIDEIKICISWYHRVKWWYPRDGGPLLYTSYVVCIYWVYHLLKSSLGGLNILVPSQGYHHFSYDDMSDGWKSLRTCINTGNTGHPPKKNNNFQVHRKLWLWMTRSLLAYVLDIRNDFSAMSYWTHVLDFDGA